MSADQLTPEVLWAQRSSKTDAAKNFIYLTISVADVPKEKLKLDLKPTGLTFTGQSDTLKKTYHVELDFYDEIDTQDSKINHTGKNVEMVLRKKDLREEYWPRLLKDSKKVHFLKTDFDKWVDEDEQEEAPEDDMGMGGMGDMSSMMGGAGGDFGGIDFSKLGGGDAAGEEEEDDDEEMPALEGEDEAEEAEGSKPKISEVEE